MLFQNTWRLLPQRIALHEATATAVMADVHLGYSAARQRLGDAIPFRSVREEMQPLLDVTHQHKINAVVVAGDLFENGFDADLCQQFLEVLNHANIGFLGLIPGNHDRGIERAPLSLPLFTEGYTIDGWHIVHGDQPIGQEKAIMGHWHPAIFQRGRKAPCFLTRNNQLVLPAFSSDAAGVDIRKDRRWGEWRCFAIDGANIVEVKK